MNDRRWESTRRAVLSAATIGTLTVTASAVAAPPTPRTCPIPLARQLRAICDASGDVDYEDPLSEAAYYDLALPVVEAAIEDPAACMGGLKMKARAVIWAGGGTAGTTLSERAQAALALNTLAAPSACEGCAQREHL